MAYIKKEWKDQNVERPKTYRIAKNDDGSTSLVDSFGLVDELGTPVNADNLNHIEEGIAACDLRKYKADETYEQGEWVTAVVNDKKGIYESLVNDNLGNPITDSTKWQEVSLGGGSLEICDIGIALFVDETKGLRRYLNGQIVAINSNTQAFLEKLLQIKAVQPDLFTTEENWQAESALNVDGCVYKYVINFASDGVTAESVRLPKYPEYIEVTKDNIPVVGNGMTLGLTNGTNNVGLTLGKTDETYNWYLFNPNGYGTNRGTAVAQAYADKAGTFGVTSDPANSGIETLSTGITKLKLKYYVQIATGSETENNILNSIELNNPYTLLESKYSNEPLYNLSWLRADGSFQPKMVYPKVYEALQAEYNIEIQAGESVQLPSGTTYAKRGLAVKLTDETHDDYDFVLNTSDETFRLPLKNNSADDLTEGLSLYYYIGETVQNANLIDAGRFQETLAGKQDKCIHIIDTYINGTSGYRVWSDGFCEQWGHGTGSTDYSATDTIQFLKEFKDIPYNFSATLNTTTNTLAFIRATGYRSSTAIGVVTGYGNVTFHGYPFFWRACGYLKEGEY